MRPVCPPIDYPIYGLDEAWRGPRWLEFVQFKTGERICEVSLAHGDRRVPTRGHTYLHVTTRSSTNARDDQHGTDSVRALAWLGLFNVLNLMAPDLSEVSRRDLFWRNALAYVDQRADRCRRWASATWVIDGVPSLARFARFAGAWSGFVSLADGVGLVVVGYRISPHGLGISRATSGEPYGFDLAAPIVYADTLVSATRAALGDHVEDEPPVRRIRADYRPFLRDDDTPNELRPVTGTYYGGDEPGRRFDILARSPEDARQRIRDQFGPGRFVMAYSARDTDTKPTP